MFTIMLTILAMLILSYVLIEYGGDILWILAVVAAAFYEFFKSLWPVFLGLATVGSICWLIYVAVTLASK